MSRLAGRIALITGSSKGIGAAIAHEFARQGAAMAVHGWDEPTVKQVASDIQQAGGTAIPVVGDVTSFEQLESVRRQIEDQLGPVDLLVANAGGNRTPPAPFEEIPEAGWRATVDANLLATFLTVKCFLPTMKQRQRGTIITIASSAGRTPSARVSIPYAAAKAGVILMTQDLAAQVGPSGIRVNCIAPETILTAGNRTRIPAGQQATMAQSHPLRRLGTPEDVAHTAVFLASDEASWLTGQVIDVSGGAIMV